MRSFKNLQQLSSESSSQNYLTVLSKQQIKKIKRMFIELQPSSELVHIQFCTSVTQGKKHICFQIDKWLAQTSFKQFFIYYDLRNPLIYFSVISNPHSQQKKEKNSLQYRQPDYERFPFKLSNSLVAVRKLIDVYLTAASSHWIQMQNMHIRMNLKQQEELIQMAKGSKNIFVKYLLQDYASQTFQQDFSKLYSQFYKSDSFSKNNKLQSESSSSSSSYSNDQQSKQEVYILNNKKVTKQKLSKYKKIHHYIKENSTESKKKAKRQKIYRLIAQKANQKRVLEILNKTQSEIREQ